MLVDIAETRSERFGPIRKPARVVACNPLHEVAVRPSRSIYGTPKIDKQLPAGCAGQGRQRPSANTAHRPAGSAATLTCGNRSIPRQNVFLYSWATRPRLVAPPETL